MARITLISRNFPPLSGGMERLVHQLYQGLHANHTVSLIGPSGCEKYVASGSDVWSTTISPTPLFLIVSFFKGLYARISGGASDVIIGGSGLVGPVVVVLAKLSGAKSMLLLHGLDIIADSRVYQWFFVPFLKFADVAVCNSKNTARLAMQHGVKQNRIVITNPGVDMHVASASNDGAKDQLGLAGKKILLSVGRLMPRKGLAEFVDRCFVDLSAKDSDWVLLVAGSEPKNALNRPKESVLARINATVAEHGLDAQVQLLGHVDDDDLALLYAAADAFVFPLIEMPGDVEGFGMVAVEAAVHGTPTVAFDCGGVSDAVADGTNGALVEAGDYVAFAAALRRVVEDDLRQSSKEFAKQFSWENYGDQIEQSLKKVMS